MVMLKIKIVIICMILINLGLLVFSIESTFVTANEARQLPAGIAHWRARSFALANDSPPLARMIATLPALFTRVNFYSYDLKTTEILLDSSLREREEELCAHFANGNPRYFGLVRAARLINFLWWLLGAWVIGRWTRELYGDGPMLLGLGLWCLSPNVLAQEQVATGALPAAVACVLATYLFRLSLKAFSWRRVVVTGFVLGIAQLLDFMSLVMMVSWPMLAVVVWPESGRGLPIHLKVIERMRQFILMLILAAWAVNAGYGFRGTGVQVGDLDFVSRAMGSDPRSGRPPSGGEPTGNRFQGTWMARLFAPVPADYIEGLDRRWHVMETNQDQAKSPRMTLVRPQNLLPELAAKVPLGIIGLMLFSLVLLIVRHPSNAPVVEEMTLWIPFATALAMVSPGVGLLSPDAALIMMAPFGAVILGKLAYFFRPGHWRGRFLVIFLGLWAIVSGLLAYPHPRGFLNEAVGGSRSLTARLRYGPWDGGQDLFSLKDWLRKHSNTRLEGMAVRSPLGPAVTKLPDALPMANPGETLPGDALFFARRLGVSPGYYALDPEHLKTFAYRYFQTLTPVARVGASIALYRVRPDDTDRLRRMMALPPFDSEPVESPDIATGHLYRTFRDSQGETSNYAIFVPPGYRAERPYPLIMLLHGYGDRGVAGRQFTAVGVPSILKTLEKGFRFLVLSPQGRSGGWNPDEADGRRAMELLDSIQKEYRVDPNRIYLTGISSGGAGVWSLAARFPDRWAAIVPVASNGDPRVVRSIYKIPCWCFHNSHDAGSPVANPRRMIQNLREAGATPKYTEFFGLNHNCWDRAYSLTDLYDWLLQQRRP